MSDYQFDHVHLRSPDPLKTAQFYETLFSARRVETLQRSWGTFLRIDLNGQQILISPPPPAESPRLAQYGLNHFALKTNNLQKAVDDLKTKGVKFVQEVTTIDPHTKVSFFLGPESVLVELLSESLP